MYTDVKNYQIIIALLKKYGIKHCVLSAGTRNVPFVHSVEQDPFFKCYSVVDERSAGYFALGLAQELNVPVVISCTSSTATCNYWPAVAEAYYQNVPLLVLTSDRDYRMLGQWEDQMIDQVGMYDRHVKKSLNLPMDASTKDDFVYCQRLVNEGLLELTHNSKGPVHINVPTDSYSADFYTKTLPDVKKIDLLNYSSEDILWKDKIIKLKNASKILIAVGQNSYISDKLKLLIEQFFKKYNCSISVEYMGNLECVGAINTSLCFETRFVSYDKFKNYLPDIVISFGCNIMQGLKEQLKHFAGNFEHWSIQPDGKIVDMFKSINNVFECTPEYFFSRCIDYADDDQKNDKIYHNSIIDLKNEVKNFDFEYSGAYAIKNVVTRIPSNSILHLSINDSIRVTNFFELNPNIKIYANIGTHGIDGCLSSFLGQAYATNKPSYLVIGDLSFFYDMNALRIKHIKNNIRILLINNDGGSEFYYNGAYQNDFSDLHTCARHHTTAKGWAESVGFKYISASTKDEYDIMVEKFMKENSEKPILFEVFTEMRDDAKAIYKFYSNNKKISIKEKIIKNSKEKVKSVLKPEQVAKIKNIKGKIFNN